MTVKCGDRTCSHLLRDDIGAGVAGNAADEHHEEQPSGHVLPSESYYRIAGRVLPGLGIKDPPIIRVNGRELPLEQLPSSLPAPGR